MSLWSSVFLCCVLRLLDGLAAGQRNDENVQNKIASNPDLSEFYGMIERNELARAMLEKTSMTVFAPTNEAFQKYKNGIKDDYLLFYHMSNLPYRLDELPGTGNNINTVAAGNPPLWVTRVANNEVFINNARINPQLTFSTNFPDSSKRKVLHIIGEVLQPLRSKKDDVMRPNPNAWGVLDKSEDFKLASHSISVFASRVRANNKENIFRNRGPNTYLIPVDEGLMKKSRSDAIDGKVIDAHVIPEKVLFLSPTPENKIFETTAFTDLLKVIVSFPYDRSTGKRYVKSNTVIGDQGHVSGAVLSEIVLANIPVSNGVVHLIKQPLMIIDKTVQQFIDENYDGPISTFKQKLKYASEAFRSKLNQNGITLFIPSNAAWKNENVEKVVNNTTLLENILNLHLISDKLTVGHIRDRSSKEVNTLNVGKKLYFNVIVQGTNHTLTVEGGGVNATVIHSDIAATNGVIHIIDRVLGIPYATVGRKVAMDPMLNVTYTLGKYKNFNGKLDDITQNYTYFVPRDLAWRLFSIQQPSLYNVLMQPAYAYQVLEKHLVVSGNFTMAELKKIANDSYLLPTANGGLTIRVREEDSKGYSIEWNGEWVPVYRPDVRCTNGIIHIIDKVLISPNDIKVPIDGSLRIESNLAMLTMSIALPLYTILNYHLSSPIV